jgi:2-polyprenyl-6-methoxyphenol hydroxylase-like FAD-dependent oxidoreductase
MFPNQTDVLVVGAGPVGMLTALALAKNGLHVEVIDKEEQTAAHSHACVLHGRTLGLLAQVGLADEVLARGRRIDQVAFYEGQLRRAELKFSELRGEFPFVVVLPQNDLEDLLERELAQQPQAGVHWSHRLADLQDHGGRVVATIDKLCETSKGYAVATWQHVVQKTINVDAAFVVGADGRESHVGQVIKIEHDVIGSPEYFAVFEFESDAQFANEIRVVLDDETSNLFCPLPGNRGRWTFQIAPEELSYDAHLKDRLHARVIDPSEDEQVMREMHRLIGQRAPWFDAHVAEVVWFTVIAFERRLARQYGVRRCWLAGDAAHSTSPLGMQSMNVGLWEGAELAHAITAAVRHEALPDVLAAYDVRCRNEWRQLLGLERSVIATSGDLPWTRLRSIRMLSCVPASGDDLSHLLGQIGLAFQPLARAKDDPAVRGVKLATDDL